MNTSTLNATLVTILNTIWPFVLAGAIIVTFIAVVMTGFEIIMNRKDDDKRSEALKSLIYVAIGTIFIVGALFITNVILGMAGDITDSLEQNQASATNDNSSLDNLLE